MIEVQETKDERSLRRAKKMIAEYNRRIANKDIPPESYNNLRLEWHDGFSTGITCGFIAGVLLAGLMWWLT